jgi:hypothetical protein
MRVLQVVPSLASRTGGPAFDVVESSRALRRCGLESTAFATDMGEPASAKIRQRVRCVRRPPGAFGGEIYDHARPLLEQHPRRSMPWGTPTVSLDSDGLFFGRGISHAKRL